MVCYCTPRLLFRPCRRLARLAGAGGFRSIRRASLHAADRRTHMAQVETTARPVRAALLLAISPPGGATGSGGRVALVLETLKEKFSRVDVVSMAEPGDELRADQAVHLVPRRSIRSRWAATKGLLQGGSPFVAVRATGLTERLRDLTDVGDLLPAYDLVWSHFLATAPTGLTVPAARRVLDADFAVGAAAKRAARLGVRRRQRIYLTLDAAAITRREQRLCGMFEHVVVVSELERSRLGQVGAPVTVVPNAVAGPSSQPAAAALRTGLLFVGSLDYDVNEAAVELLIREVLPHVRSQLPSAELTIVGRNPSDELVMLARAARVKLVANAPSLDSFYSNARAIVAPLRGGGGTRIKLLEAMASSLAIVGTPTAIDGLELRHGSSALVAADPAQLAEYCVAVLKDTALADRLGQNAHAVWSRDHQPTAARAAFSQVLESVIGASRGVVA